MRDYVAMRTPVGVFPPFSVEIFCFAWLLPKHRYGSLWNGEWRDRDGKLYFDSKSFLSIPTHLTQNQPGSERALATGATVARGEHQGTILKVDNSAPLVEPSWGGEVLPPALQPPTYKFTSKITVTLRDQVCHTAGDRLNTHLLGL